MKHFTLKMKSLLCMLLAIVGLQAHAQESITVGGNAVPVAGVQTVNAEDAAEAAYSGKTAEFSVAAVTEALGIESITEAAEYIVNPTTWEAVENTSDGWRNGAGDLCGWGDITEETRGYCVKIQEPETGVVDYLGAHHNGVWTEGETFTAYWGFVANDKAALVKVVVTFGTAEETPDEPDEPAVELPEAETTIANLQIVGTATVSNERYYTQGYETSDLALVIPNMAEALGVDKATLAQAFSQMVYVDQFSEGTNTGVLNLLTVTDGWMRPFIDSETDEITGELIGAMYGADDDVYVQQMAYNAENDSVTFVMGQMPGGLELGDARFVNLYVVYGNKAFIIKYSVNFVEPPFNGLEDMNKVGEQTIAISQQPTNDYSFVTFSIDLEAIAALLGAENSADIQMQALGANGGLSNDHTANNGGWWLTSEGIVTTWGSNSAFFVEPSANNTWTEFHAGQFPDASKGGDTFTGKFYLTYGQNYYELTVNYTIEEKQDVIDPDELHVVAQRNITIAQELNDKYAWSEGTGIPYEYLIETIGTATPHLYALSQESTDENPIFIDEYTCDPKPGFWLTADGKQTTWGASSPWGISVAVEAADESLVFNCIQFPGQTAIGNTYTGSFYLANPENGAMLQVNVIFNVVESVSAFETVGEETLVLKVSNDDECHQAIALEEIAAKMGFETEDDLLNSLCMSGVNAMGVYVDPVEPSNGMLLTQDGYIDMEAGTVGIYFDGGTIYSYCNEEIPAEWKANVELCFQLENKRYILHVTLVGADIYDDYVGVRSVSTTSAKTIYDLQGRQVKTAQRGIYIVNGHKVIK